jgi:hypothetical protein
MHRAAAEVVMNRIVKKVGQRGRNHIVAALGHVSAGVILSLGIASSSGCALDEADQVGEEQQELVGNNGMSLNGMNLNGMNLNGMSLNGVSLNGMNLNGMSLNGMNLNGMNLNGSQLGGVTSQGQPVSGPALVGATLDGLLSNGDTLALRIDTASHLAAPNADVWAYAVSFQADDTWHPLCGTAGDGQPVLAIPLRGSWSLESGVPGGGAWTDSSTSFTLGCRATALAKCVEFGYKPWQTHAGESLRDHHQACTRMLRADYCGNGRSWTANGTPINLYDSVGIQSDDATWAVDAEWTAAGAICTNHIRDFQPGEPSCVPELTDPACGTFGGGALLINEYGG